MIEDILYKAVFIIMLIAFPLFYLISSTINLILYFKKRNKPAEKKVSSAAINISLMCWCSLLIVVYAVTSYISNNSLFSEQQVDIWFYIPLVITVVALLFKRIRRSVFSCIFFVSIITIGWIIYITFFQLSLS